MIEALVPLAGGGLLGFAVGYFVKKLLKWVLIGAGALILLLGYLEYQRWITTNWTVVENQTQIMMNHSLNTLEALTQHMEAEIPVGLGVIGFVPGLVIGLAKG